MSTVTISEDLARILTDGDDRNVRLVNADGKVVGYFSSVPLPQYSVMDLPPPLTREEVEERMKGPWYTTEEVLAQLKSLE